MYAYQSMNYLNRDSRSISGFELKFEFCGLQFENLAFTIKFIILYVKQVVENIARKHGISKSDLLEREADDLPVRIALGEAQVLSDTKKYLSSAGVNVAALEESASKRNEECKRSNHIILVKNLPYSSTEGELADMFKKYGSIERIILPSTKALALVFHLLPVLRVTFLISTSSILNLV